MLKFMMFLTVCSTTETGREEAEGRAEQRERHAKKAQAQLHQSMLCLHGLPIFVIMLCG